MKLSSNLLIILILIAGVILGRVFFPRKVEIGRNIPTIITKFDTVRTTWHDTVRVNHFTTDTFNLVIHQTIHDTVVINVTDARSNIWPVVSFRVINRDSANVRTFSLRSGNGATSTIYTPGPLNNLLIDSTPTPHMTFGIYPVNHTSTLTKLFYSSLGYGLCSISNLVRR